MGVHLLLTFEAESHASEPPCLYLENRASVLQ